MNLRLRLFCLAAFLIIFQAQAATGPDGNNLPSEHPPPVTTRAIESFHDHAGHDHAPMTRRQHQEFAERVDLKDFRKLAVFDNGTVKIIDTLARERLTTVYGKPRWADFTWDTFDLDDRKDQEKFKYDPVFTYLDLVFNRSYYADKPILYVEVLPFREKLLEHLPAEKQEQWKQLGRISWEMFADPRIQEVYRGDETSLAEMKGRDQLFTAADAFINAGARLRMISPPPGSDEWRHVASPPAGDAEGGSAVPIATGFTVRQATLPDLWAQLGDAWSHGDAEMVNSLLETLTLMMPVQNPQSYPPAYRLTLERIYNATGKFTIGYWLYAVATLALILALGTGRKSLLTIGVTLLLLGLLAHAGSFAIRAVLSGRWAIHNQYESFIAISLFAVIVGVVFMFAKKMWVFGAAAGALGTISLLVANLWAIPSHEVGQVAGILATSRILYVHVNMVLVSYGLIALSFFVSLTYLGSYYFGLRGAAALKPAGGGPDGLAPASSGMVEGSAASSGGEPPAQARRAVRPGHKKLLADLDQAQLTLMQLAFWLLGVGIMLGAYWADHAWGRWWAWDPKETWALITWIVYLIAIHVRFGVRNRGLVTAWLSVAGFIVMLWTYWGVNLLLAGLHSYA